MTTRHVLAPLAAAVTGAAALAMLLVPAAQRPGTDDDVDGTQVASDPLDGWANRDIDIGDFGFAARTGSWPPDGRADQGLDRTAVGAAEEPESILDGWGNRDMDIGAFGFAARAESLLDGWANRDLDIGAS